MTCQQALQVGIITMQAIGLSLVFGKMELLVVVSAMSFNMLPLWTSSYSISAYQMIAPFAHASYPKVAALGYLSVPMG